MEVTFKTKLDKSGNAVDTIANLNFDNCTPEQLHELAKRSVVIILQAQYRTAGTVPEVDEVDVAELFKRAPKGKASPEKVAAQIKAMSEEEKAAILKYLAESMPGR